MFNILVFQLEIQAKPFKFTQPSPSTSNLRGKGVYFIQNYKGDYPFIFQAQVFRTAES